MKTFIKTIVWILVILFAILGIIILAIGEIWSGILILAIERPAIIPG